MIRIPFKKLHVWQKAMELADLVYTHTREFPHEENFGLKSQIRRCAVSIPSNIAEGSQRGSDKEFANFLLIAKGSLAELETQLLLADRYLTVSGKEILFPRVRELEKMLFVFHKKLTAYRLPLTAS